MYSFLQILVSVKDKEINRKIKDREGMLWIWNTDTLLTLICK